MSTDDTAATEMLEPLPDVPGPAPDGHASGPEGESAAGPGMPPWSELHEQADEAMAAGQDAADRALAEIAADHRAALDALDERPEIPQQDRPVSDQGQPFDVAAGSFDSAASCPKCGYALEGPCVHVHVGQGARRSSVTYHERCAGEAL